MNVLLPQPDGPMKAVTKFLRTSIVTSDERGVRAVANGQVGDLEDRLAAAAVVGSSGLGEGGEPRRVELVVSSSLRHRRHAASVATVVRRSGAPSCERLVTNW